MFAKPTRQRFTLLSTLVLMSAAALGGWLSARAGDEAAMAVEASSENMSVAQGGQEGSACGPSCYGRCWNCILGVCENLCQ